MQALEVRERQLFVEGQLVAQQEAELQQLRQQLAEKALPSVPSIASTYRCAVYPAFFLMIVGDTALSAYCFMCPASPARIVSVP